MSRIIATLCLFVLVAVCSTDASSKQEFVRQLGGACGEYSKIIATCAAGLTCKDGYCEQKSYLSAASASCREIMIKAGVIGARDTVPVHDGFCYKHCDGMYERAMAASDVTYRLLRASDGSQAFAEEFAKLSASEKALFKAAEDMRLVRKAMHDKLNAPVADRKSKRLSPLDFYSSLTCTASALSPFSSASSNFRISSASSSAMPAP